MLDLLAREPVPALLLLLGGLLAFTIAVLGNSKKTSVDSIARGLGFFVGLALVLLAIALVWDKSGATSTWLISLLLGVGLFFKIFKKVPVAALLALLIGAVVGFFLLKTELSAIVVLSITVVVMLIVFIVARTAEFLGDLVGRILGLRPVLLLLGIIGMIESVLLFMQSSLSSILAVL
ncbi:MAG: hypothetical protein QW520_02000 [Methanomassiliicoccales archaeon]